MGLGLPPGFGFSFLAGGRLGDPDALNRRAHNFFFRLERQPSPIATFLLAGRDDLQIGHYLATDHHESECVSVQIFS
jgi:hypothetical protein